MINFPEGVTTVKLNVPAAAVSVSFSRYRSNVAASPSAVHAARCFATGRTGNSVAEIGVGSDLKFLRLSTMPEWFSIAVDSQPEIAAKSSSSLMRAFSR